MADEALVSGTEKLQVEDAQKMEKVNASEQEKNILPEKLQCDSSESGSDSGLEKEKDAALVKGGGQGEKKKKKVLKKKKKKGSKKNEGEGSMADKLQCDSSHSKSGSGDDSPGSKSGSGDDSSNSKSGSGDDSKSESGCAKEVLGGELKKEEKKKGLIEKIREKLSRKLKDETAEVANEEILETKEEDKQNLGNLQCDSTDSKSNSKADSGSESCSGKEKDTVLKGGAEGEKKKVLRKKIKKKATKKNEGEASTADKLHCHSSDSKSSSGDDSSGSKSGSKSGSGSDSSGSKSGSSRNKEKSKVKRSNKEKEKREEENQTAMAENEVPQDTKVDEATAEDSLEVIKEMEKGQDEGWKVKELEADEQGAKEKKSIFGKIMEKLPGYNKNGGE